MEESNLELKICNQSVDHLRHNLDPLWAAKPNPSGIRKACPSLNLLRSKAGPKAVNKLRVSSEGVGKI